MAKHILHIARRSYHIKLIEECFTTPFFAQAPIALILDTNRIQ